MARIGTISTRAMIVLLAAGSPAFVTGKAPREIQTASSMSASERAEGAKAHPQLLAEFGGLYEGPQSAYVTNVGRHIAVQSSLSGQQNDFTISLLNSPVNNAFAIPGGYVYVTRQLMALMNDEAELAGVLGHEVGHVAAQHGKKQQSAATRNSILGVLGQVLVGAVAGNSGLGQLLQQGIGTGSQLLTLRFSRSQEYEADDLGIRYLAKAGYDPQALSTTLASLAAQNTLDARLRGSNSGVPEWASTHPDPASRVRRAAQNARATGVTSTVRNADVFLRNIDGMLYGDDPKEGIVEGSQFLHPAFKLKFSIPQGFYMENGTQAVSISGSSGQARFSGGRLNGSLEDYVARVFQQVAGNNQNARVPTPDVQRSTINGLPVAAATVRASDSSGRQLDVTVIAYQFGPAEAYHFMTIAGAGQGIGPFAPMVNSLMRMSEQEAAGIKPRRVRLVTVQRGDTIASLAGRMAFPTLQTERFLTINALAANATLTPGRRVKIVTY